MCSVRMFYQRGTQLHGSGASAEGGGVMVVDELGGVWLSGPVGLLVAVDAMLLVLWAHVGLDGRALVTLGRLVVEVAGRAWVGCVRRQPRPVVARRGQRRSFCRAGLV